jgi:hypothetical protein
MLRSPAAPHAHHPRRRLRRPTRRPGPRRPARPGQPPSAPLYPDLRTLKISRIANGRAIDPPRLQPPAGGATAVPRWPVDDGSAGGAFGGVEPGGGERGIQPLLPRRRSTQPRGGDQSLPSLKIIRSLRWAGTLGRCRATYKGLPRPPRTGSNVSAKAVIPPSRRLPVSADHPSAGVRATVHPCRRA